MLEAAVFCLIKVYSLKEKEYKHFHKITYTFEQTGLLNFNFNFFLIFPFWPGKIIFLAMVL